MSQVVVITGANNGIGLHMTLALLEQGYRVAALDLSGENLEEAWSAHPDDFLYVRPVVAAARPN